MERLSTALSWHGLAWGGLLVCAIGAAACGEPSCPGGSIEVNGRCEPVNTPMCRPGEVQDGGACIDESGLMEDGGGDAGGDLLEDAAADASEQDADTTVTESEDPLCDALDCGEHGACRLVNGAAVCECDAGFIGDLCDACEDDLVLEDGACVTPCESADAPSCGENGACVLVEGAAICECVHPFDGDLCEDCAEGFALQTDGTCEPDCGVCGAHSVCNETLMTPACECVGGYVDDGVGCDWVGDGSDGIGITNGGLTDSSGWTMSHVQFVAGTAKFVSSGSGLSCELGSIEQVIDMPSIEDSEPFAVEIDITSTCSEANGDLCPPLLLEVGDAVTRLPVPGGSGARTLSTCLGARGYGEDITLRIRPGIAKGVRLNGQGIEAFDCASDQWPAVDAVRIVPASETCSPIDWIANESFDSSSHWELTNATISGGALTLQSQGEARTNIVVPSTQQLASSALELGFTGAASASVRVSLDGLVFGNAIWPSGSAGSRLICLPDWARGAGHRLRLQPNSGTATVVTEVKVVSSPSCGDGSFDRGFERYAANAPLISGSWEGSTSQMAADTDAAHSGTKGLRMAGALNAVHGLLRVPTPGIGSGLGPAFQIWHKRTSASLQSTVDVSPAYREEFTLGANSWQEHIDCLPKAWSGQPMIFMLAAALTGASAELHFDDVGPILSAACD